MYLNYLGSVKAYLCRIIQSQFTDEKFDSGFFTKILKRFYSHKTSFSCAVLEIGKSRAILIQNNN